MVVQAEQHRTGQYLIPTRLNHFPAGVPDPNGKRLYGMTLAQRGGKGSFFKPQASNLKFQGIEESTKRQAPSGNRSPKAERNPNFQVEHYEVRFLEF
jgi:hypothetical protein